jgi:hypothetical protein
MKATRQVYISSTCDLTWRAELPLTQSWEWADASARYGEHFRLRRCWGRALARREYTVVVAAAREGVEVESGSDPDEVEDGVAPPGTR